MKKAMKLVWMVLFALPMISLTACGDDDELKGDDGVTINLKDYSDLLDKTKEDVMKKMNIQVADEDNDGIYYENVAPNVEAVDIYYTFFEENEYGAQQTYNKSVMVDVELSGFSYDELYNFCTDKYGKGQLNDDILTITKGDMYVWLDYDKADKDGYITYVKKSEWDKITKTKAGEAAALKVLGERRAARR